MVKLALLFLLVVAMLPACAPARRAQSPRMPVSSSADDTVAHVQFILDSQRPSGAIAMRPDQGVINPYFGNLAARALLRASGHLLPVQRYMNWYLAHLKPDGTIDDYHVADGQEISTGDADSTDSYAATFLSLVAAWIEAGGDSEWVARNREKLDQVTRAITAVTDQDGLTWAKPGYPSKLLMDNCEVYRGWLDWSRLMSSQGDHSSAALAHRRSEQVRAALLSFRQPDGLWGWAITRRGSLVESDGHRFYPDSVAQVFPLVWGLTDEASGFRAMDAAQPTWRKLQAGDFPWLLTAYAAALAGDLESARQALASIREQHPDLQWPWFVAESAWVIETRRLVR